MAVERLERRRWRGGLVGPIILIALGVVFLLNNLGVLGWSVWEVLFRLWPVLLIAFGLDLLIGRRSPLASLAVVVLTLALLGGAFWMFAARPVGSEGLASEQVSQTLGSATRADVDIAVGIGVLRLDSSAGPGQLVDGTVAVSHGERVNRNFRMSGDTAYFALHSEGSPQFPFQSGGIRGDDQLWKLSLSPDVPMRLKLSTGVGDSTIDLGSTHVTDLRLNTGVGKTMVTLPSQGRVQAVIRGGVGEATVVVPDGVAARIRAKSGLGDTRVEGNYQRQGDLYVSPGYDTAENRVDLDVNGGVGRITVQSTRG